MKLEVSARSKGHKAQKRIYSSLPNIKEKSTSNFQLKTSLNKISD